MGRSPASRGTGLADVTLLTMGRSTASRGTRLADVSLLRSGNTLACVGAEYVWTGESLVVLSAEEVDEIRRQLEEAAAYPERRRPSDAEVVNVRPEYL
jgi:hypothetical protein